MCLKVFTLTCANLGPCNRTVTFFFAFQVTLQVLAFSSFIKHWLIQTLGLYICFKYSGVLYKSFKLWFCILVYASLHVLVEHAAVRISVTW